ncbi:hypothetical protein N7478_001810 [Penicillium angulare]|uniref:uncharacterized protein n=1 Tax=Penicillium angulare TaxID=116970 RepID=UPI002541C320|nr:uncharacterized protein N7478_001810 [Penicillium angulare]KAJ5288780.1 hypothetical protein N7478_001810 [Penicillium angulare]
MPIFETCMAESFMLPLHMDDDYDEEIAESNLNLKSLMARLFGKKMIVGLEYPVWVFREALEEPHQRIFAMNPLVDLMKEWIYHSGEVIYASINGKELARIVKLTKPGTLYNGESSISHDRWKFWKEKLPGIAAFVSGGKKSVLKEIERKMTEIENLNE